jgi:hypothetical protein
MENINDDKDLKITIQSFIEQIQEIIQKNKDERTKEIGDKVIIWDGSYNVDKNTGKHRFGIDKLFANEGMVIETNCTFTYVDKLLNNEINLDLLVRFETGEEIYTRSDMVKRIDNNTI